MVLGLTAAIHTKGTVNSQRHHLSLGHKQAVSKGTPANACLDWDIIDGPVMRIRLHNLRKLLSCMGFVRVLSL